MLLHPIAMMRAETGGVGDGTRRKLVSASVSANTGMRTNFPSSTFSSDAMTVSFWWKKSSTNASDTIWASQTGQYQLYTGSSGANSQDKLQTRMDGSTATALVDGGTADGTWIFVYAHYGVNHSSTTDVFISVDDGVGGSATASVTTSGASSDDITAAHTQYFICDDNNGAASDDGFIGEFFDFCVFDGIVAAGDLQHDGSGNWQNLSATGLAALVARYDGQSSSNAGLDTSGNGHDATVESSGVTTSATGLPAGA